MAAEQAEGQAEGRVEGQGAVCQEAACRAAPEALPITVTAAARVGPEEMAEAGQVRMAMGRTKAATADAMQVRSVQAGQVPPARAT